MKKRLLSLLLAFVLVLGMLPASAFAVEAPFTATVNGEIVPVTKESTLEWSDMYSGSTTDVTCYTVAVPEGTEEVTVSFDEDKQICYYDLSGNYIGYVNDDFNMTAGTEHTVPLQDTNNDGALDGISVQLPGDWSAEYYIQFVYGTGEGGEEELHRLCRQDFSHLK